MKYVSVLCLSQAKAISSPRCTSKLSILKQKVRSIVYHVPYVKKGKFFILGGSCYLKIITIYHMIQKSLPPKRLANGFSGNLLHTYIYNTEQMISCTVCGVRAVHLNGIYTSGCTSQENNLKQTHNWSKSRIHERTISFRFLGVILRLLILEVSVYIIYITNQFKKSVSRCDCE
jgi:hypothetical protein